MEGVFLTPEHFPQEMGLSKELCSLGVNIMQWLEGQIQELSCWVPNAPLLWSSYLVLASVS